ncbi:CGNR zinc finger domain-containing protein [Streptomyces palmae]|uniref:Zf-CGNR multi-domain protein n=1 Tax=Streptomyces palmae TaxID=1701085 RepID=A0A4Z0H9C2_9ACTN|nr:CGNR zinc finger domain-containing protein [Streptomyces palmae]TGB10704.1 zf-CGNR multi-domain protein [Streptomyces palmae]
MPSADPRPLVGEPVSLDLMNTRWNSHGQPQDLLTGTEGMDIWLRSNDERLAGVIGRPVGTPADPRAMMDALLTARDALAAAVREPGNPEAVRQVDAVLAHGRIRAALTPEGPTESAEFEDPAWAPAWAAAYDYLRLLRTAPDRIRACAHPRCVVHFFDTSRNGTRRWCSMAGCGNRAKASRHYARARDERA